MSRKKLGNKGFRGKFINSRRILKNKFRAVEKTPKLNNSQVQMYAKLAGKHINTSKKTKSISIK